MSRSYTPLPLSASMACSGTALPFFLVQLKRLCILCRLIRITGVLEKMPHMKGALQVTALHYGKGTILSSRRLVSYKSELTY
jgi:hypothetical protein